MEKCLVTKLNGAVNNNDLLRIGECVVGVESSAADELLFQVDLGNTKYYCEQSHKSGEEIVSAGSKKQLVSWTDLKSTSAGLYRFHFLSKYYIKGLLEKSTNGSNEVKQLNYLNNVSQVSLNTKSEYALYELKQSTLLKILMLKGNVTGDISSLSNMTALTQLSINSNNVTGDISSLSNMTALKNVEGTLTITGKVENLKVFPNLVKFNCTNATEKDNFGDIATLPASFTYLFIGSNASISWSSRPSTSKIIGVLGSPKLSNIDKMLQDQAQCVIGITSSTPEYEKSITATGTRTSASDAAVQTLQSKGYTVSITPA